MRKQKLKVETLINDLKTPACVLGGVVAGAFIKKGIQKIFRTDSVVQGLGAMSETTGKLMNAAILIGGSLIAYQYVDNKLAKWGLIGVASYGGYDTIKSFTGKDLLAGDFAGFDLGLGLGNLDEQTYYPSLNLEPLANLPEDRAAFAPRLSIGNYASFEEVA